MPNFKAIAEQLNAARLPGEKCEYIEVQRDGKFGPFEQVELRIAFNGVQHSEAVWCETGLKYTPDGLLDPSCIARTHSNTKFSLTKKLQRKYLKTNSKRTSP